MFHCHSYDCFQNTFRRSSPEKVMSLLKKNPSSKISAARALAQSPISSFTYLKWNTKYQSSIPISPKKTSPPTIRAFYKFLPNDSVTGASGDSAFAMETFPEALPMRWFGFPDFTHGSVCKRCSNASSGGTRGWMFQVGFSARKNGRFLRVEEERGWIAEGKIHISMMLAEDVGMIPKMSQKYCDTKDDQNIPLLGKNENPPWNQRKSLHLRKQDSGILRAYVLCLIWKFRHFAIRNAKNSHFSRLGGGLWQRLPCCQIRNLPTYTMENEAKSSMSIKFQSFHSVESYEVKKQKQTYRPACSENRCSMNSCKSRIW